MRYVRKKCRAYIRTICLKTEKCIRAASQERHRRHWEHSLGVDSNSRVGGFSFYVPLQVWYYHSQ